MSRIPQRFVGLHNHTCASAFDGLGYPDDHFKWCMENGLDGHAVTEHGHFNSYAHAQIWIEKWNKEHADKQFLYIPGIEAYFHPDLKQWARDKEEAAQAAVDKKAAAKLQKKQEELQTKLIAHVDSNDETEEIEVSNALTIENEDETRSSKHFNPVNRRHHLLLLPKNQKGLLALFAASSKGYLQGFYRFPRIDLSVLKEAAKDGDIIASSACLHPSSLVITNNATITLFELVNRVNSGIECRVLSYDEKTNRVCFRLVTNAALTRKNAKLLSIKLKNGKELKLTADHKVYTQRGWIEAGSLATSDKILSIHR